MNLISTMRAWAVFSLVLPAMPVAVDARVEIVTNAAWQDVFFYGPKIFSVTLHNPGGENYENEIRVRIFQTSSAPAALLSENSWKRLQIPAGETVLESAALDFPVVKAETRFLIQWLENSNSVLGQTEILVYPTNLLVELKPLAGDEPLGVFDPQNQLKPLLKNLKLEFTDLENLDLENFSGRLAIIGPFQSQAQLRDGLAKQIQALAKKGRAIVWIQAPPEKRSRLQPSFYSVSMNTNAVVVVQPELVANLPGNPQSQLNMIFFCKLALHPQPPALPDLSVQP